MKIPKLPITAKIALAVWSPILALIALYVIVWCVCFLVAVVQISNDKNACAKRTEDLQAWNNCHGLYMTIGRYGLPKSD